MEETEGISDAREFRHDVGHVEEHQQRHSEESDAQAELFANEIRKSFARNGAHAGAHFLGEDEHHGDGKQGPERKIAEARAGLRISDDTAGVIIHHRGDEAGADDGEEDSNVIAETAEESEHPAISASARK
jgi:hypothetical protein